MTDTTPGPDHRAKVYPFAERARKAFAGAFAGAASAFTPTLLASIFTDGVLTVEEVGLAAGALASGAIVGFLAVYWPKNAPNV